MNIPKALLATLIFYVVTNALVLAPSLLYDVGILLPIDLDFSLASILQVVAVIVFLLIVRKSADGLLLKRTHPLWYPLALVLGFGFVLFQVALLWLSSKFFGSAGTLPIDFDGFDRLHYIPLLARNISYPIVMALFFQGYIQRGLQERLSPILTILVTSFLFAMIHLPIVKLFFPDEIADWFSPFIALFCGFIAGGLFFKSRSIGPVILLHLTWCLVWVVI